MKRRAPGDNVPPLTDAQQALVKRLAPLVIRCAYDIARKLFGAVKAEDLVGPGMIGLCNAVRRLKPEQKHLLARYAEIHIRWRMRDAIRTESLPPSMRMDHAMKRGALAQLARHPLGIELLEAPEATLEAGLEDACEDQLIAARIAACTETEQTAVDDALVLRQEHRRSLGALESALQEMDAEDRYLIVSVDVGGKGLEEISQELGVHYNTAQRRHKDALRRLGKALRARKVERAPEPID